jgi:two-component system CitB family sensor kinase
LQSIRKGIIAINKEGIITTFNNTAIESLGFDANEIWLGQCINDVIPESNLLAVIEANKGSKGINMRLRR